MKFYVRRTSDWRLTNPPCDGAIEEKYVIENVYGEKIERTRFFINIESLEELMGFISEQGEVVVGTEYNDLPTIEIYDGYRE